MASVKRLAFLLLCTVTLLAQSPVQAPVPLLGVAWYPEQWPESRWEADLTLMEQAHVRMVRVGEFAWSRMEPADGRFDFDWLDLAISAAARHHIATVLGTPTAAPPAWLTQKYPDTLRIDEHGIRDEHGNRQQFSWDSSRYRQLARRIAEQMALRFGHNPNVIGWQIDNEYANTSYDDHARMSFENWLHAKYQTLDNLNQHWTTSYWSQTYFDWSQIPIPKDSGNPGLRLEWMRFVSDTWRSYQKNQIDAIRAHGDARQFITTNMMGFFPEFDHYEIAQDLTFASWDDYVGEGQLNPAWNGMTHDLTRGFKRQNFWIMETQPGMVNWAGVNNFLDKGEVRAMAWHGVGHGADTVSYWQWRSALNGQEQYHGTLVGADGTPVPLYTEVQQLGAEFARVEPILRGTSPHSDAALLYDYDSMWAIRFQKHTNKYDHLKLLQQYYKALRTLTQSLDVVNANAPLENYKLVVAPDLNVLPEATAKHLLAWVQQGGHLVLGPRSGMKDEYNALWEQRQPGPLESALGGRVEQFYALEAEAPIFGEWGDGRASVWAEQLSAHEPQTKTLLTYGKSNGWLDSQPAAITRNVGRGSITYIGAWLDDVTMGNAAKWMVSRAKIAPALGPVPEGVEVNRRSGPHGDVFILENFAHEPQPITLPQAMRDELTGTTASSFTLNKYGVAVLTGAH
ncbi:MAG: beta-galactosidase [Acidobacteriaceae bacterium]